MEPDLFAQITEEATDVPRIHNLEELKRGLLNRRDKQSLGRRLNQAGIMSSQRTLGRKGVTFGKKYGEGIRAAIGMIQAGDNVEYTLHWPPNSYDRKQVVQGKVLGYFQDRGRGLLLLIDSNNKLLDIRVSPDGYNGRFDTIIKHKKIEVNPKKGTVKISLKPLGQNYYPKIELKKLNA